MDKILLEIAGRVVCEDTDNGMEISLEPKINTNVVEIQNLNNVNKTHPFFIAGFLTAYENPLLYKLASSPLFHIQWTCEAHCLALLAERLVISKK